MKKVFSCFLAGIILFNCCGDFILFKYRHFVTRMEMKAMIRAGSGIPSGSLQKLVTEINDPDVKWIDPGELIYHGRMYDVVSKTIANDRVILVCINDRSEETLISNYSRIQLLASRMGSRDKTSHHRLLQHLMVKQALVTVTEIPLPATPETITFPLQSSLTGFFQSPPVSPPPEGSC